MQEFNTEILLNGTREDVYNAITVPFCIQLWTGYPAVMSETVGEEFSLYEGDISGKNLELVKNKKIVQQWNFDSDIPSIATITLKVKGHRTLLIVKHDNIPDDDYENIAEGWLDVYLDSLKNFLDEE